MSNAYLLNPANQKILSQFLPTFPGSQYSVVFTGTTAALNNLTPVANALVGLLATDIALGSLATITGANGNAPFSLQCAADSLVATGGGAAQTSTVSYIVIRANP